MRILSKNRLIEAVITSNREGFGVSDGGWWLWYDKGKVATNEVICWNSLYIWHCDMASLSLTEDFISVSLHIFFFFFFSLSVLLQLWLSFLAIQLVTFPAKYILHWKSEIVLDGLYLFITLWINSQRWEFCLTNRIFTCKMCSMLKCLKWST